MGHLPALPVPGKQPEHHQKPHDGHLRQLHLQHLGPAAQRRHGCVRREPERARNVSIQAVFVNFNLKILAFLSGSLPVKVAVFNSSRTRKTFLLITRLRRFPCPSQHASVTRRVPSARCVRPAEASVSADPTSWAGTAPVAPRPRTSLAPPAAEVNPNP